MAVSRTTGGLLSFASFLKATRFFEAIFLPMRMLQKGLFTVERRIWLLLLAGLAIRVLYLLSYQSLPDWDQLTVDNYFHHHWAQSIADGNFLGDTTFFRAPLYIYLLGGLYSILGDSLWIGRLFGLLIGLGTILMTYRLGSQIFSRKIGLIGAAIYAFSPIAIYFEHELLLDPLFMLLMLLGLDRFLSWLGGRSTGDILLTGILFGLAAITRPTILVFFPVLIAYPLFDKRELRQRLLATGVLMIGLILIIGPVFVRNISVAGDPVLISSQGGINFYIGNNETADGIQAAMPEPLGHNWRNSDSRFIAEQTVGHSLSAGELSAFWYQEGIDWIISNPAGFAKLYLKKLYLNISSMELSNNRSLPAFFDRIWCLKYNPLIFGLIFPLAMLGLMLNLRQNKMLKPIVWLMLALILTGSLFFINARFRLPLLPLYYILAASGIVQMFSRGTFNGRSFYPSLILAVALGLLVNVSILPANKNLTAQDELSKGLLKINQSDFPEALAHLRTAQTIDARFPTTNLNIGVCFFRMQKADSAKHYFDLEKSYHPNRPRAYINSASLALVNDDIFTAAKEIERALELRPYDLTAQLIALRTLAIADTGLEYYLDRATKAASSTKNDTYLLNEVIGQLLHHREFEAVTKFADLVGKPIKRAIETDDSAFDRDWRYAPNRQRQQLAIWFARVAHAQGQLGNFDEAINLSAESLSINQDQNLSYQNLIASYHAIGQHTRADSVETAYQRHKQAK